MFDLAPFLAGLGVGLVAGRLSFRPETPKPPPKPIIHMRGDLPAWYDKCFCEYKDCGVFYRHKAAYIDQDGRYWCERHLPENTKVAERAAMQPTKDGRCVRHDYKCPKPWEPY